jgi:predicted metalloprotease with PDZ domain
MFLALKLISLILIALLVSPVSQAQVVVDIVVDQAEHHQALIKLSLPSSAETGIMLKLPAWRTGRYQILDQASGIREFAAEDDLGQALSWKKVDKSSWLVHSPDKRPIKVSYRLYANHLADRSRHIDETHAFIDASAAVMYTDELRTSEYQLNLFVPEGWRSVSQMLDDLKRLVSQATDIWDEYPFERYVFMVHATSGIRGATEHINSSIIQRSRYRFHSRDDYLSFLSTAAHEFVHTWNVKAYRPQGLVPYNYQSENYTTLLWQVEGATSYLQEQLLTRSGLMNAQEFLTKLAKKITAYQNKPGRWQQSVAQASFDAWIDEKGDRANNASVNIYSEGFLISWLLDFELLATSNLKYSYRDLHRLLFKKHRLPQGYVEADVLAIIHSLTEKDYQQWWQQHVHGMPNVDFNKLLKKAGLKLTYGEKDNSRPWIGVEGESQQNGFLLTQVQKDGPAWQAGLTPGDIVIAIDGLRYLGKNIRERLDDFNVGEQVEISFFRRDQLFAKTLVLGSKNKKKLTLTPVDKPRRSQKKFFKAWTGLDLPSA